MLEHIVTTEGSQEPNEMEEVVAKSYGKLPGIRPSELEIPTNKKIGC